MAPVTSSRHQQVFIPSMLARGLTSVRNGKLIFSFSQFLSLFLLPTILNSWNRSISPFATKELIGCT
ncbi:uncharacterized protein BO97DRAFT_376402 [Aspergillus homomorphus CBS 101889]|uniref:Uncharacterized protein n=1 Tax=Aspergillus homomorphus (strain CBS 101889) TaxID=1450537 RepID=A0A395HMG7_ASPHC|nr:hypothetical protein BO97DRAFT_376402 [Aspergillus homomorphus CBS 101889]RAL08613.1 hypothetical protein BO97DRAFT_376402 [Aspergillus homomorphus CBS 101889]